MGTKIEKIILLSLFNLFLSDDVFFNRTGLERVGIVGPGLGLLLSWSTGSSVALLCKNKKEEGPTGASPMAAPMPKSVPP